MGKQKNISRNPKETAQLARIFVEDFLNKNKEKNKATVVGLYGELGSGKTTFTKEVAKALGIKKNVTSPTFVIMRSYPLKNLGLINFVHIDAYRLKDEKEMLALEWQDLVNNPRNLIFIEWPEKIIKLMPKKHLQICFGHIDENSREIIINKSGKIKMKN